MRPLSSWGRPAYLLRKKQKVTVTLARAAHGQLAHSHKSRNCKISVGFNLKTYYDYGFMDGRLCLARAAENCFHGAFRFSPILAIYAVYCGVFSKITNKVGKVYHG